MREASGPITLDEQVIRSLWNHARYFIGCLGEPERDGNELRFPVQGLPYKRFTIRYEAERKFLGRIYVMVLEGWCPASEPLEPGDRVELRYSGFFKKEEPLFIPSRSGPEMTPGRALSQKLSRDSALLDACQKLEVESLKVVADPEQGAWKVQVRPFGGSYVHLFFPPMRYPVLLPASQGELIFSVMDQICRRMSQPAG